jgi:hypothetical protein
LQKCSDDDEEKGSNSKILARSISFGHTRDSKSITTVDDTLTSPACQGTCTRKREPCDAVTTQSPDDPVHSIQSVPFRKYRSTIFRTHHHHHPSRRRVIIMPPNRKASLSDHHHGILTSSRFASTLQTTVTAKDAIASSTCPSRPTVDESYWHWPSTSSVASDDEQPKKKDLFSANHLVANLVREASRKEEEEEEEQQPQVEEEVEKPPPPLTNAPDSYWNWHVPPNQQRPPPPKNINDRWTSGHAIERHLVRDHHHHHPAGSGATTATTTTNQQQENRPAAPNDDLWNWPTFPRHAAELRFSIAHYERQLLLAAAAARSNSTSNQHLTTATTSTVAHAVDDDYWRGM